MTHAVALQIALSALFGASERRVSRTKAGRSRASMINWTGHTWLASSEMCRPGRSSPEK
jgi:hypothetical protein